MITFEEVLQITDTVNYAAHGIKRDRKGDKLRREIQELEWDIRDRMKNRPKYRAWESAITFRDHVRFLVYELRDARAELERHMQPELFDLDANRRWDLEAIAN